MRRVLMTDDARCRWPGTDPLYVAYHDTEWGVTQRDPRALREMLVLEGFQAGLSWITILRKRPAFRAVFDGFDPERVARWGEADVARALADPGIVRHRGKIEGAVKSARAFLDTEAGEGFAPLVWGFVGGQPIQNHLRAADAPPADSPESRAMSNALKSRGFTFCGPVTTYAFMQAAGLVNDHIVTCPRHAEVAAMALRAP